MFHQVNLSCITVSCILLAKRHMHNRIMHTVRKTPYVNKYTVAEFESEFEKYNEGSLNLSLKKYNGTEFKSEFKKIEWS